MNSSVGIATDYGLDVWGLIPSRSKRFFSTPQCPDWLWILPACYPVGTGSYFPRIKQLGRKTYHSSPPNAELKNEGAVPLLPYTFS
jgi:hypothetical protein